MSRGRELISFLGQTKGTCSVLAGRLVAEGWRDTRDALLGHSSELLAPPLPQGQPALAKGPLESGLFLTSHFHPLLPKANVPN